MTCETGVGNIIGIASQFACIVLGIASVWIPVVTIVAALASSFQHPLLERRFLGSMERRKK
jgi:hypothetical protein